ncbi:TPA: hypothetical protein ACLEX3_005668 [Pseudomonas aeruginosa]
MLELALADIHGVHPDFARVERELDLAPIELSDRALVPSSLIHLINRVYPLVVSDPDRFCIGQTALYRWLTAYASPEIRVSCLIWPESLTKTTLHQLVLAERLVAPALARITAQQVRDLYTYITPANPVWPHGYRSHAHLAHLVGVKPIKGNNHQGGR